MRNVFRSFGLAVVISSTNGTARNLVATSNRSGRPFLWCVVVPSFPREDIIRDYDIPELLMEIIRHSRPLFARIALEYVQASPYNGSYNLNDYLNAMTRALVMRFKGMKRQTDEFKIGQLCLLLSTSYGVVDSKVNIIDGHFARLAEQSTFELYLDTNELHKNNKPWECRSVLPPPQEDMLLHLTMAGGPHVHPFNEPLSTVMSKFQPPFYYDNTEQTSNDGMRLEALSAAAIVLASHAGGFGGVTFPTFLGEFLYELGVVNKRDEVEELVRAVHNAGWTQMVPFLSLPNEEWPE